MREEEINKILNPKRNLGVSFLMFFIYLGIAIVCISAPLYIYHTGTKDPKDFLEIVSNGDEEEGQYVGFDIAYLPELLAVDPENNSNYYYAADEEDHIYIAKITDKTMEKLNDISDEATGKLNSVYHLQGFTYFIDTQLQQITLRDFTEIFGDSEVNEDNFSEYFSKVYINEGRFPVGDRTVTLYTIIALIGVFFLILALGYILPAMIKARKTLHNNELTEELRVELSRLTETPYAEYKLYLTHKYIIYGIEAIKYEDVIWGYVEMQSSYGVKTARELILYTKDKKRHTIISTSPKITVPDVVLEELREKIPQMRVGYNKENKKFFEDYKKENKNIIIDNQPGSDKSMLRGRPCDRREHSPRTIYFYRSPASVFT